MNESHFTPADRWTAVGVFVFFLIPTVGSYMAFGSGVWISKLLTYGSSFFGFIVLLAFIDARNEARQRRKLSSSRKKASVFDSPWRRGDWN